MFTSQHDPYSTDHRGSDLPLSDVPAGNDEFEG
jgi:hypothetical protein